MLLRSGQGRAKKSRERCGGVLHTPFVLLDSISLRAREREKEKMNNQIRFFLITPTQEEILSWYYMRDAFPRQRWVPRLLSYSCHSFRNNYFKILELNPLALINLFVSIRESFILSLSQYRIFHRDLFIFLWIRVDNRFFSLEFKRAPSSDVLSNAIHSWSFSLCKRTIKSVDVFVQSVIFPWSFFLLVCPGLRMS